MKVCRTIDEWIEAAAEAGYEGDHGRIHISEVRELLLIGLAGVTECATRQKGPGYWNSPETVDGVPLVRFDSVCMMSGRRVSMVSADPELLMLTTGSVALAIFTLRPSIHLTREQTIMVLKTIEEGDSVEETEAMLRLTVEPDSVPAIHLTTPAKLQDYVTGQPGRRRRRAPRRASR